MLLAFFDGDRCKLTVPDEALPLEFAAALQSEFIQEQEQLRRKVNILAKVLDLSKSAINYLASMPLQALEYAMKCFQLEERVPGVYAPLLPEEKDGEGETVVEEANTGWHPKMHSSERERESPRNLRNAPKRTAGILQKWDSERGFGFIHEEDDTCEEPTNIFLHRSNLMGSTPGHPVDVVEGRRISFIPGFQDGRARAMNAAMIDDEFNVDSRHLKRPKKAKPLDAIKEKKLARLREDAEKEEHPLSKSFLQFLCTPEVQTSIQDKRQEGEAWFRTVGLLKLGPGRRDDALWRKEVDRRIDIFMEKTGAPMTKKDMDFRCKRFLMEFCMRYNVIRVSEALAMVEKMLSLNLKGFQSRSTAGKRRDEVRSWPAYVATLLRRFDPTVTLERKPNAKAEPKKAAGKDDDKGEPEEKWEEQKEESASEASIAEGSDDVETFVPATAAPGAEFAFQ
eukprot:symbB.v1.2.003143.t1/scaffold177.1/size287523/8